MSAPRTKRQFAGAASDPAQRQITSFFLSNNTNNSNTTTAAAGNSGYVNADQASQLSSTATRRLDASSSHIIPATVQANLLSVGMRVRKSVPEGYKTGSYSAFALWDESDAETITAAMGEGQRSRANAFSSPRELLPFCGIHSVGGLGTQPDDGRPTPAMPTGFGFGFGGDYDDDVPGLTYSQESVESEAGPDARTRKRGFVEDEEDDLTAQLNIWRYNHNQNNNTNSSNSSNSNSNNSNNYTGSRLMAVPSKGRRRAKFSGATAMPTRGQENLMVVDNDFEEAQFLDRDPWEVDMHDA